MTETGARDLGHQVDLASGPERVGHQVGSTYLAAADITTAGRRGIETPKRRFDRIELQPDGVDKGGVLLPIDRLIGLGFRPRCGIAFDADRLDRWDRPV